MDNRTRAQRATLPGTVRVLKTRPERGCIICTGARPGAFAVPACAVCARVSCALGGRAGTRAGKRTDARRLPVLGDPRQQHTGHVELLKVDHFCFEVRWIQSRVFAKRPFRALNGR